MAKPNKFTVQVAQRKVYRPEGEKTMGCKHQGRYDGCLQCAEDRRSECGGLLSAELKKRVVALVQDIDSSSCDVGYYSDGSDAQREARDKNLQAWKDLGELLGA